jgi:hypothetical protein
VGLIGKAAVCRDGGNRLASAQTLLCPAQAREFLKSAQACEFLKSVRWQTVGSAKGADELEGAAASLNRKVGPSVITPNT